MILIIHEILPKSNGKYKLDIIINNTNSEIVINKTYTYSLTVRAMADDAAFS
jgi:hypothetical protein